MSQVQLDVTPELEGRNRLTVAFRIILAIPHLIIVGLWWYVTEFLAFVHWLIQVFSGQRSDGLFNFTNRWLNYASHVWAYTFLLYDEYPGFIDDKPGTPVTYTLPFDPGPINRLTVALRLIWAIPAAFIAFFVMLAAQILAVIAWFAILFTGKMPANWAAFIRKGLHMYVQTIAYLTLSTDDYPTFGGGTAPTPQPAVAV